jgi:hypothetical protein
MKKLRYGDPKILVATYVTSATSRRELCTSDHQDNTTASTVASRSPGQYYSKYTSLSITRTILQQVQ